MMPWSPASKSSKSPSSSTPNGRAKDDDDDDNEPSDEVDALRWKFYGKNEEFRIMHDAATTIQAFWRGCSARTMTSAMIQDLIEEIMAFRKLEAEYKRLDEEERRKRQEEELQDHDEKYETAANDVEQNSGLNGHVRLARRKGKNKPWQKISTEADDFDDRIHSLATPTRNLSRVKDTEEEDEESSTTNDVGGLLKSVHDDGVRGYRRYKTNIHGKNKSRPWRDDTNVFDAF
jgi:hypothetical protein